MTVGTRLRGRARPLGYMRNGVCYEVVVGDVRPVDFLSPKANTFCGTAAVAGVAHASCDRPCGVTYAAQRNAHGVRMSCARQRPYSRRRCRSRVARGRRDDVQQGLNRLQTAVEAWSEETESARRHHCSGDSGLCRLRCGLSALLIPDVAGVGACACHS
jgi:hypothetical protein